ncbi:MAG TPA: cytochrome c [Candidatus Elarobacter sp.]|jgi:mono/diheme cytochrome c family protein
MQFKPIVLAAAAAIAALVAAGCAKGGDQSSTTTTTTATSASAPAAPGATSAGSATTMSKVSGTAQGDAGHGKTVFAANCARCHAAEGGIGPSLKNEKSRKNYAQTVAWIRDPQPPMPKLYPDTIGANDVADVAAYVQSL